MVANNRKRLNMVGSLKKQAGQALIWLLGGLLTVGGGAYYYTVQNQAANHRLLADNYGIEFNQLIDASNNCYNRQRRWCTFNELQVGGHFSGDQLSADGSLFQLTPTPAGLSVSLNMSDATLATLVSRFVPNSTIAGNNLTTVIPVPTASQIMANRLMRYADDAGLNRAQLGTNLDFNNNNLVGIDELGVNTLNLDTLDNINDANIDNLNIVRQINLGANSISHSGSVVNVNAVNIDLNSNVEVQGNIIGNNSNIIGIDNVSAISANHDLATINRANINTGNFTNLNSTNGNIDRISGDDVNYQNATINTINSNVANIDTGNITNTEADNVIAANATINNTVVGTVQGDTANFNDFRASNYDISRADFASVSSSNISFDTLVSANTHVNIADFTEADINTVNATDVNGDTGRFTQLESDILTTRSLDGNVRATNGNVSGTTTATKVNASSLRAQTLRTGSLNSSNSDFGRGAASTYQVSGQTQTQTVSGNTGNVSSFTGSSFIGGSASGSDFNSSQSSVNANYALLKNLQTDINDCINVSGYCFPKAPVISNIRCPDCIKNDARPNFSTVITATVSECQRGCNYSWALNGLGGSCSSGSVSRGSSRTVSCQVNGFVPPNQRLTNFVTLQAVNSSNSNYNSQSNININWFNTQVDFNLENEVNMRCSGSCYDCSRPRSDCGADYAGRSSDHFDVRSSVGVYVEDACRSGDSCSYQWSHSFLNLNDGNVDFNESGSVASFELRSRCSINGWAEASATYSVEITNHTVGQTVTRGGNISLQNRCLDSDNEL